MYYSTQYCSPVGRLTLACDGERLTGLWLEGQKYFGGRCGPLVPREGFPILDRAREWLDRYFAGERPTPSALPLAPAGSEFRQVVWRVLLEIPYGTVVTYGAVARETAARLGRKSMSGQAVGGAVGHNPISILIPCHRVVGAGGSLTGYAGGIGKKIRLLQHEGVDVSRFSVPRDGSAL